MVDIAGELFNNLKYQIPMIIMGLGTNAIYVYVMIGVYFVLSYVYPYVKKLFTPKKFSTLSLCKQSVNSRFWGVISFYLNRMLPNFSKQQFMSFALIVLFR